MSSATVASAANVINVWEIEDTQHRLTKHYEPERGCPKLVSDIAWSHDGKILGSVSEGTGKVILEEIYSKPDVSNPSQTPQFDDARCLSFTNTSNNSLVIGSTNGKVLLWDLKGHKPKVEFQVDEVAVTQVTFNHRDTTIIASTANGGVTMYGAITGQNTGRMKHQQIKSVMCMRLSQVSRNHLGTSSEEGSVALWDWAQGRFLHCWTNPHSAPATSLVFSPLNHTLLLSVGLDQRLCCFDIHMRTKVRDFTLPSALTTVDFLPDGVTVVMGSTQGQVVLFDLRASTNPKQSFAAHTTPVLALRVQPVYARRQSRSAISAMSHKQSLAMKRGKHSNVMAKSSKTEVLFQSRMVSLSSSSDDVFEQIKALPNQSTPESPLFKTEGAATQQSVLPFTPPLGVQRDSLDGIISPLDAKSRIHQFDFFDQLDSPDEALEFSADDATSAKESLQPECVEMEEPSVSNSVDRNGNALENIAEEELEELIIDHIEAKEETKAITSEEPDGSQNKIPVQVSDTAIATAIADISTAIADIATANKAHELKHEQVEDRLYEVTKLLYTLHVQDTKHLLQLQDEMSTLQQSTLTLTAEVKAMREEMQKMRHQNNLRFFTNDL